MWLLPWKKKDKSGSPSSKRRGGGGSASAPSSPRLPYRKSFGMPLESAPRAPGSKIPLVVEAVVSHLRATALDTEGVFRVPGSVSEVNELMRAFDEGQSINLKTYDQHALAGLLKKYFRELPSSLILPNLNAQIAALFTNKNNLAENGSHKGSIEEVLNHMRSILFQLPPVHFESLKCLVGLLVDLYKHTINNKMSLSNLVTCVVPSLDCSPAIITYSIQNYDFFFSEQEPPPSPPPSLTHSAPQPILSRRSVSLSPGAMSLPQESPAAASPRHTIALHSPASWLSGSGAAAANLSSPSLTSPSFTSPSFTSPSLTSSSNHVSSPLAAAPRNSESPPALSLDAEYSSTQASNHVPVNAFHSPPNSPLSISLPTSPRGTNGFPTSLSQKVLSASGGLLPPPPRSSSSSPSRRGSNRFSVAMTTSQSSPPGHQFSPRASLSLQISTSYPHTPPQRGPISPRSSAGSNHSNSSNNSNNSTSSPYGPDWNLQAQRSYPGHAVSERPSPVMEQRSYEHTISDRPILARGPSDLYELRPRASSYAPQPTYLFGSDGEELDEKESRRKSFQAKAQDPLRYTRSKSKRDKDSLVDEMKEKEKEKGKEKDGKKLNRDSRGKSKDRERKEAEKLKRREREKEKEREREKEKEKEREATKDREKRWSRRITMNNGKEMMRKIEDLQVEIQKERERNESAAARTAEIEARLRMEEHHSNALKDEIEKLKRRIKRRSRPKNYVMDSQSYLEGGAEGPSEDEEVEGPPASNNVPWGANGKMEVKIRMPMPFP